MKEDQKSNPAPHDLLTMPLSEILNEMKANIKEAMRIADEAREAARSAREALLIHKNLD